MSPLSIQVPFPVFQDRDGQPLDNGYVWIGEPNLNPQTNPVVAYYDATLTIPAVQPLRTINGYISRAGTPAQVYVNGVNYSILVQDSKGTMVYNFPNGTGIAPDACGVTYDPPFTGAVPYPVCEKLEQVVSVKDFGAVGDGTTDDFDAIQAANDAAQTAGASLYFPSGVYAINPNAANAALNQTTSWFANNDATILRLDFGSTVAFNTVQQFNQTGLMLRGLTFDGQVTTASTPTIPNNDPAIGTYVASGDSTSEDF
jgi:hypothetical protein